MNAREMFKKLEFTRKLDSEKLIYTKEPKGMFHYFKITFDLDKKTVCASWFMEQKEITIAELRAINKQCEELNWL